MKYGIVALVLLSLIGGAFYVSPWASDVQQLLTGTRCLKDTEKAMYEILDEGRPGKIRISVFDTMASTTVWKRELSVPSTTHIHSYELQRCSFYLHRAENYDFQQNKALPGYVWDLRRYKYFNDGLGKRVMVISQNLSGETGKRENLYGSMFVVDLSDTYISLERSVLGKPDYALVIKNIETGEDEYVLTLDEVLKEHSNVAGSFDVGKWVMRPDGEYLFTTIYDGSRIMAYVYVKLGTWETRIYETPPDQMAGVEGAMPPFAPLMAYTDVIVWAGFAEMTDQLIEEQIASGQKKHLIVANLRTGKKTVVEAVPIIKTHRFKMAWISDTELEYTMPDGAKKIYRVE